MHELEWFVAHGFGRPILLDVREVRRLAEPACALLRGQGGLTAASLEKVGGLLLDRMRGTPAVQQRNGYTVSNGVALVPMLGTLVNRRSTDEDTRTSYDGLRIACAHLAVDRDVSAVAVLSDSPGGTARGITAAATALRTLARSKPTVTIVDGLCCSGAYWLAAQTNAIFAHDEGSEIGSIGVAYAHFDISKLLDDIGIKPTLIYAGAHKVDGNMFQALPDAVRASIQGEVDKLRLRFSRAVAAGRPGLPSDEVLTTEAQVFDAEEAAAKKLIDGIAPLEEVLAALARGERSLSIAPGGQHMISFGGTPQMDKTQRIAAITGHAEAKGREALAAHLAENTELSVDAVVATLKATPVAAAPAAPAATVVAAAPDAATARIAAILNSAEAKGRDDVAKHLAFNTSMTAEQAISTLKLTPASTALGYAERKAETGALGLAEVGGGKPDAGNASWKLSTDKYNARITDPAAVSGRC